MTFAPGFWTPFRPPLRQTPFLQQLGGKERFSNSDSLFPLPLPRMISTHCVGKRSAAHKKKSGLSVRDEWYYSNQAIHLDLYVIFLTLSPRITCTSVESHWGELVQLTCRPHNPTNPDNHHYSESMWSICYDSAYNSRAFDQYQNAMSLPGCIEPGLLPLLLKLW